MVIQLIGVTEQRNCEVEPVEEELSLVLSDEETLEADDLPLPDPANPISSTQT